MPRRSVRSRPTTPRNNLRSWPAPAAANRVAAVVTYRTEVATAVIAVTAILSTGKSSLGDYHRGRPSGPPRFFIFAYLGARGPLF